MNNLATELYKELGLLDESLAEFKEHPMYAEWLELDEVSVLSSIYDEEEIEELKENEESRAECRFLDSHESL